MSNKSYIESGVWDKVSIGIIFQFPVGMSNKSYLNRCCCECIGFIIAFQFPVGMSNKSYISLSSATIASLCSAFNSPWECRISLTVHYWPLVALLLKTFNSPWECRISLTTTPLHSHNPEIVSFQFPVGMSNKSYRFNKQRKIINSLIITFNSPWECRISLTNNAIMPAIEAAAALSIPRGNVE